MAHPRRSIECCTVAVLEGVTPSDGAAKGTAARNGSIRPRAAINRLGDIGRWGPDPACSVDSSRGLGKIGTVGSTYFSEIEKVLL